MKRLVSGYYWPNDQVASSLHPMGRAIGWGGWARFWKMVRLSTVVHCSSHCIGQLWVFPLLWLTLACQCSSAHASSLNNIHTLVYYVMTLSFILAWTSKSNMFWLLYNPCLQRLAIIKLKKIKSGWMPL
jgi:hypothetical protein